MPDEAKSDDTKDGPDRASAWEDHATVLDRIIAVAQTLETPRTASWIADEARVAESTARDHLQRLVELRILTAVEARGTTTYYPDAAYQRFTQVSKLVEERDRQELEELTVGIHEDIEGVKEEFDVEDPQGLRSEATDPDTPAERARSLFQTASEWESMRHTLSLVEEAIDRYDEFTAPQPQRGHAR